MEDDDGIKKGFTLSQYLERSFGSSIIKNINLTIYTDQFSKGLQLIGLEFKSENLQMKNLDEQINDYVKQQLREYNIPPNTSISKIVMESYNLYGEKPKKEEKIIDVKNEIFSLNNLYDLYGIYKKNLNNNIKLKFYFVKKLNQIYLSHGLMCMNCRIYIQIKKTVLTLQKNLKIFLKITLT